MLKEYWENILDVNPHLSLIVLRPTYLQHSTLIINWWI